MSEEIVKAIIASVATIAVAGLGLYGVVLSSRKPSKDKPPTTSEGLEGFSGTQNEFMSLVIRDNSDLREQLKEVRTDVAQIKDHQENFLGAVRRYLMKLATAWRGPEPMPWPDDADFHILEETLPSRPAGGAIILKEDSQ